ncbi:tumor necrosis factor ligand superfamily member 10 isoform X2 [Pan paniscus]|uniref:tumor necrosis factor ligand superfamily member 10 isoform X2 n=1 Tax=Pan paniscus TaxID=9597 RepID=UPI00020E33FE|nr:tumor necrosis factor ligand superfamily member 10 isoform X3 [Gorilla gorilla gorilla]XP_008955559.1 tumor necrosis factor ligand superfamily member 10 isoform X2 [Pan paniscus]XP_009444901.1 tumor necrosis factor ligand superfamily member 10 isoform X2 [Pan troglodytes]
MAMMEVQGGPSLGQTCVLIVVFTVLLQSLCVAVTYVYFTNELKQFAENDCQRLMSGQQTGSLLPS